MVKLDQELADEKFFTELNISRLWNLKNKLQESCELVERIIEKHLANNNTKSVKASQARLFYLIGNLELIDSIFMEKTENIFSFTEYAEICIN